MHASIDSKAAMKVGEDKTATAEDMFYINSCGYGTKHSAVKLNERILATYWE